MNHLIRLIFCILLFGYTLTIPQISKSIHDIWKDTFNTNATPPPEKGGRGEFSSFGFSDLGPTTPPPNPCERNFGWKCTPYHECSTFSTNEDLASPVRLRSGNEDRKCPLHLEICCHVEDIVISRSLATHDWEEADEEDVLQQCGVRREQGVGVGLTGIQETDTQFGEFPWMVAILRIEVFSAGSITKEIALYICAGSLIASNVVLTAAHCVDGYSPSSLRIRAGEWDTQQTIELLPYEETNIKSIIQHPRFNPRSLKDDFALLETETLVSFAPHVGTVCLPSPSDVNFLAYHTCFSSGWGKDTFEGTYQNIMKKVKLDLMDRTSCQKALRSTRLGRFFRLDSSFTCAGGVAGVDTCKGDGGAPLVCTKEPGGAYVQVGIVAWGIGCGEEGIPGVYADVTKRANWIQRELQKIPKIGSEIEYDGDE